MNVAVVGLGWVAATVWLPRLLANPDYRVVAVVEPDGECAARSAAIMTGCPLYSSHRDVPLDGLDAVFVLTPNHTHAEIGSWFLRRGCAVLLEKPTCVHPAEIELLSAAAEAGGGRLGLSAAARHRADVAALRNVVRSGVLGTPRLADLSWVRARGIPRSHWFTDRRRAGGGVLIDLGWHVIDVALDLWGPVSVRSATACASADFLGLDGWGASWHGTAAAPSPPGDVEDQLTALVATDSYGLRLRFAWASHEDTDETVLVLHGTDGTAELHTTFGFSDRRRAIPSLRVKRSGTVAPMRVDADGVGAEYDRQLTELTALRGSDEEATKRALDEARDVLRVVDACYSAARI
jgi:oxidoreductase